MRRERGGEGIGGKGKREERTIPALFSFNSSPV